MPTVLLLPLRRRARTSVRSPSTCSAARRAVSRTSSVTADDVTALGKRVLSAERDFNARAGFKMHRQFVEYQAGRDALDLWSSPRAHAKLFIT